MQDTEIQQIIKDKDTLKKYVPTEHAILRVAQRFDKTNKLEQNQFFKSVLGDGKGTAVSGSSGCIIYTAQNVSLVINPKEHKIITCYSSKNLKNSGYYLQEILEDLSLEENDELTKAIETIYRSRRLKSCVELSEIFLKLSALYSKMSTVRTTAQVFDISKEINSLTSQYKKLSPKTDSLEKMLELMNPLKYDM